jgi:hypothetical protein
VTLSSKWSAEDRAFRESIKIHWQGFTHITQDAGEKVFCVATTTLFCPPPPPPPTGGHIKFFPSSNSSILVYNLLYWLKTKGKREHQGNYL